MHIERFTFNPFSENTYVISDESGECLIIDPGMSDEDEDEELLTYIRSNQLTPVALLNTHCHLDHILGNGTIKAKFGIPFMAHRNELAMLERAPAASLMWDVPYRMSPVPDKYIDEPDSVFLGEHELKILFVPGHAPGHLAFVSHTEKWIIGGDVLFQGSVGRVDLPGSNGKELVSSIQNKLYTLPDDYVVFPGHGGTTTIGSEKKHNVFIRPDYSAF